MKILKTYRLEIIMLLPLVLYIIGFTFLPVMNTIFMSFQNPHTGAFPTFANYQYIFGRRDFNDAFWNTMIITGIGLTLEMTIGLVIALMLTKNFKGRGVFRSFLLIPMGVPTLVSAVTMTYIFNIHGYLNELLYRLHLIKIPVDWAGGGLKTLLMIVFADMWKVTPMVVLLLLAGLESIPGEVYEAASIDGASTWQTFRHVTLPLLKPSITMTLILRAIDAFRIFELPMVLAGKNTPVLSTYAYMEYNAYNNPYTSAAGSTILLVMILIFIFGYLFVSERNKEVI